MGLHQPSLLLAAQPGWRAALLDRVAFDTGASALELRRLPGTPVPLVDNAGSLGGFTLPAAVAVDLDDRVYVLDAGSDLVRRFDPCTRAFETVPCVGTSGSKPRQLSGARGLAISTSGDMYVADTGNRRLQVFALDSLTLRRITGPLRVSNVDGTLDVHQVVTPAPPPGGGCIPDEAWTQDTWLPWDVAVSWTGMSYVTDYANGLVHVFDRLGEWREAHDGQAGGGARLQRPTRVALDRRGRLYVVQEGQDFVTVLDANGIFVETVTLAAEVAGRFCPIAVAVDAAGVLHVCDDGGRLRLFKAGPAGRLASTGSCAAPGDALTFDLAGNPVMVSAGAGSLLQLTANATFETQGRFITEALDSQLYQCEWDRLQLEANVLAGTQIIVDTFTSEIDRSIDEVVALPDERWATGLVDSDVGRGSWDCLLGSPPGRYLWLRLTLIGRGEQSPAISRARVFYPRATSRRYLPAVFSEDPEGRTFLDRFLSIFDSIRAGITGQIDGMAGYFDPASTPADDSSGNLDFLSWLGSWIGLSLDRQWPVQARRRLLEQAHRLYRLRGTPAGLLLHVRLFTGIEPRVLEHFKLRRWMFLGDGRLGDDSSVWGRDVVRRLQLNEFSSIGSFQLMDTGDPLTDPFNQFAHRFTLFLPRRGGDEAWARTLVRIVELAKPAHTEGVLHFVEPRMRVGCQAFVGIDTVVGEYPDETRTGDAVVGQRIVAAAADEARPPRLSIGKRSRIGSTTVIE